MYPITLTGLGEPERVQALVYIDAQVPLNRESLWNLTTQAFREAFIEWVAADGYSVAPPPGLDERVTPHPEPMA